MSFEANRLEALAQLEIAQATTLEFVVMAAEEKDRNKIKARIFFGSTIKEIRDEYLILDVSNDLQILDKILATKILEIEQDKPKFEDFKKVMIDTFKQKTLRFSIDELVFSIRESVSLATLQSREELRYYLRQFLHAVKELSWHDEWIAEWKHELKIAYIDCLAEDREKFDELLTRTLDESIKFRGNTNKAINAFYETQHRRVKEKFNRKYKDHFPDDAIGDTEDDID